MTRHLSIAGTVQGVGYRAWLADQAQALQLTGWVRNRRDGSVEAMVAGNASAIDILITRAWHGPSSAQVSHIAVDEVDNAETFDGKFAVLSTL